MCLCALAAEGQEPPQVVGLGQLSPLLSYHLDNNDHYYDRGLLAYCSDAEGQGLGSDLDLLTAYCSDEDGYGCNSSFATGTDIPHKHAASGSGSVGRETVLRGRGGAVNNSDSSDFEEGLAREREDREHELGAQEEMRGRRVVFVHDVPVYL